MHSALISVIVPVFNEEKRLSALLPYLRKNGGDFLREILVVDGCSTDSSQLICKTHDVSVVESEKGRAKQMNRGATEAVGEILYFVHADTLPPASFAQDILNAVDSSHNCGRFRTDFDSSHPLLKINAYFTRFRWFVCGGGDQTFFITKNLFHSLGGYDENHLIMEDYDMTEKAKKVGNYCIIPKPAIISARKYNDFSWFYVQKAHWKIVRMYHQGEKQEKIKETYHKLFPQMR